MSALPHYRGAPVAAEVCVPRLVFPLHVWQKLHAFVQACPVEINGFGLLVPHGRDYIVVDVFITDQVAGPGHVDVDPLVLAQFMTACIRQGIDTGQMRFQWHSHVDMPAYFSSIDTDNIDRYDGQWMASMVLNKAGDYEARLDVYQPFRMTAPLRADVLLPADEALSTQVQQEVANKVKVVGTFWNRAVRPDFGTMPIPTAGDSTEMQVLPA